jgi:hypothetical protein
LGWKDRGTYYVVEFREQFSVKEEIGRGGKFISDSIEEDFGAVVFVLLCGALFAFYGEEAQFEDVNAVAKEDCFSSCTLVSIHTQLPYKRKCTYLLPTAQR